MFAITFLSFFITKSIYLVIIFYIIVIYIDYLIISKIKKTKIKILNSLINYENFESLISKNKTNFKFHDRD